MSAARAMSEAVAVLYLRLPARADAPDAARQAIALPFALSVRGRVQRQGFASTVALAETIRHAQRVVLLLAASDVTVLRVAVPPLPSSRLKAALPALVEDRIIGDPADCVLAAGPDEEGSRTVAIVDHAWLQQWVERLRASGVRRLSALPVQLCLPLPLGRVAAAVLDFPHPLFASRELVLRLAPGECAGLSLGDAQAEAAAPMEVLRSVAALAAARPLQLSVPVNEMDLYQQALNAAHADHADHAEVAPLPDKVLRADRWEDWIEGASEADVDLMTGLTAEMPTVIDWQRWRFPLILSVAVTLLNVIALNWDWWQLHRQENQLRAEMLRTYRSSFPNDAVSDDAARVDLLRKMKQKVAALRRAAGESSPEDFLALTSAVGDAWPALQQGANMDTRAVSAIEYRDGSLQLRLKPGQQPSLDVARRLLAERRLSLAAGSDATSGTAGETKGWLIRSEQ